MRELVGVWTCVVLTCGWAMAVPGELLTTKVTAVLDGNTLEIADAAHPGQSVKVVLYGVDCPELGQRSGGEARDYVNTLCLGLTVTIQTHRVSKANTVLGEVTLPSGVDLNRRLLERGLAWLASDVPSDPELAEVEQQARAAKRGLWQESNPTPPWEYRKSHPMTQSAGVAPQSGGTAPPPSSKASATGQTAIQVSRSAVEQAWDAHGIEMLAASGAVPYVDASGVMAGALVPRASAVPLARQLGLRDGDVVLSVNGVTLKGLDLTAAAKELENKTQYRAEILRGGAIVVLNYSVTK
ncbi:MAG: thermonuclease family protein [Candidatus Hydrogenedentes bacterium]|nr:thermonuclease family protein [Candidatus Hydrogenedentota bacterium]